jgi:UDPglucose 6-dehydrogenase
MNEFRKKKFFLRVYKALNHNLRNKKVAIFGTAFKKDTNDPRESPAVVICSYLLLEGAVLHIHDPKTDLEHVPFFISFSLSSKSSYTIYGNSNSPHESSSTHHHRKPFAVPTLYSC